MTDTRMPEQNRLDALSAAIKAHDEAWTAAEADFHTAIENAIEARVLAREAARKIYNEALDAIYSERT